MPGALTAKVRQLFRVSPRDDGGLALARSLAGADALLSAHESAFRVDPGLLLSILKDAHGWEAGDAARLPSVGRDLGGSTDDGKITLAEFLAACQTHLAGDISARGTSPVPTDILDQIAFGQTVSVGRGAYSRYTLPALPSFIVHAHLLRMTRTAIWMPGSCRHTVQCSHRHPPMLYTTGPACLTRRDRSHSYLGLLGYLSQISGRVAVTWCRTPHCSGAVVHVRTTQVIYYRLS